MSPVAAGAFLLLSLALPVIDWWTWESSGLPTSFVWQRHSHPCWGAWLDFGIGYASLAWPAVVAFALLAAALLCSGAPWAMGGVLTHQRPGAKMFRGVFPAVLLVLCVLGWLLSKPLRSGVHFTWSTAEETAQRLPHALRVPAHRTTGLSVEHLDRSAEHKIG
jgi:hypothetical protein